MTTPGMSGLPQDSLLTCVSVARVQQPRSSPDHGPGLGVLSCRVDGGHQGHATHIANVVVDDKFEICDVYESEIAIKEIIVRILLILLCSGGYFF